VRDLQTLVHELDDTPMQPSEGDIINRFLTGLKPAPRKYCEDNAPETWWIDSDSLFNKAMHFEMNQNASTPMTATPVTGYHNLQVIPATIQSIAVRAVAAAVAGEVFKDVAGPPPSSMEAVVVLPFEAGVSCVAGAVAPISQGPESFMQFGVPVMMRVSVGTVKDLICPPSAQTHGRVFRWTAA
jgi:hypothetical protein